MAAADDIALTVKQEPGTFIPAAADSTCQSCGIEEASFGLPGCYQRRWCAGCAKQDDPLQIKEEGADVTNAISALAASGRQVNVGHDGVGTTNKDEEATRKLGAQRCWGTVARQHMEDERQRLMKPLVFRELGERSVDRIAPQHAIQLLLNKDYVGSGARPRHIIGGRAEGIGRVYKEVVRQGTRRKCVQTASSHPEARCRALI